MKLLGLSLVLASIIFFAVHISDTKSAQSPVILYDGKEVAMDCSEIAHAINFTGQTLTELRGHLQSEHPYSGPGSSDSVAVYYLGQLTNELYEHFSKMYEFNCHEA